MKELRYNKVVSLEDFSDPEISEIIQDMFRHEFAEFPPEYKNGIPDSKQWQSAMCVRALKHFGALSPDAYILGVGAGTEVLSFYLTKHAHLVFATDLYLNAGVWSDVAPPLMLIEPEDFAPYDYEVNRLIVQHMDGRLLQYPDNTFDGIYSSGSIEHFGSLEAVANASYEMGRVLKPGGILTLSTEFRIKGPGGDGWDPASTLILSRERILKYIVAASGLELVDELDTEVTSLTLASPRNFLDFSAGIKNSSDWQTKLTNYPNLVMTHEGYVFCSIHVTLKKTEMYPVQNNSWAAPSDQTLRAVQKVRNQVIGSFLQINTLHTVSKLSTSESDFTEDNVRDINERLVILNDLITRGFRKSNENPVIRRSGPFKSLYRLFYLLRNLRGILEYELALLQQISIAFNKMLKSEDRLNVMMQEQQETLAVLQEVVRNKRNPSKG